MINRQDENTNYTNCPCEKFHTSMHGIPPLGTVDEYVYGWVR